MQPCLCFSLDRYTYVRVMMYAIAFTRHISDRSSYATHECFRQIPYTHQIMVSKLDPYPIPPASLAAFQSYAPFLNTLTPSTYPITVLFPSRPPPPPKRPEPPFYPRRTTPQPFHPPSSPSSTIRTLTTHTFPFNGKDRIFKVEPTLIAAIAVLYHG